MHSPGCLLKGQRASTSRRTNQKSGPEALLSPISARPRCRVPGNPPCRAGTMKEARGAGLLPISPGIHRRSVCTLTHTDTHTCSSSGLSGGHSQPDRLSLPILCFLCLSGQGVRFRRREGEHGDSAGPGRSSPASTYPSEPPPPPRRQGGGSEGTVALPSGLWAAPSEALPDSVVPGPRALLAKAVSASPSSSIMLICQAQLQGHLFREASLISSLWKC